MELQKTFGNPISEDVEISIHRFSKSANLMSFNENKIFVK